MILLNLKDENITEKIDVEISNLESLRNFFVTQKDILLKYFNITLISMSSDSNYIIELNKFLEEFNIIFDKINTSIKNIVILKRKLELIKTSISNSSDNLDDLFNSYNETYISDFPKLLDCMNFIINFIEDLFVTPQYEKSKETTINMFRIKGDSKKEAASSNNKSSKNSIDISNNIVSTPSISNIDNLKKVTLDSLETTSKTTTSTTLATDETITTKAINKLDESSENENVSDKENNLDNLNDSDDSNYQETIQEESQSENISVNNRVTKLPLQDNNTLIISEKDNLVYLPFKVEDLKKEFLEKEKKYTGLIDLINHEYIYPISKYRNTVTSRFREAYSLMVNKEKSSALSGLELGLELAFNYSLHPAVITACKSLDELDDYLDALDAKDMSMFKDFKVEFEVLPK